MEVIASRVNFITTLLNNKYVGLNEMSRVEKSEQKIRYFEGSTKMLHKFMQFYVMKNVKEKYFCFIP